MASDCCAVLHVKVVCAGESLVTVKNIATLIQTFNKTATIILGDEGLYEVVVQGVTYPIQAECGVNSLTIAPDSLHRFEVVAPNLVPAVGAVITFTRVLGSYVVSGVINSDGFVYLSIPAANANYNLEVTTNNYTLPYAKITGQQVMGCGISSQNRFQLIGASPYHTISRYCPHQYPLTLHFSGFVGSGTLTYASGGFGVTSGWSGSNDSYQIGIFTGNSFTVKQKQAPFIEYIASLSNLNSCDPLSMTFSIEDGRTITITE